MKGEPRQPGELRVVNNLIDELQRTFRFHRGFNAAFLDGDILRVILYAALENLDIENAAHRLRAVLPSSPSPDVVMEQIGRFSVHEVLALFRLLLVHQLKRRKLQRRLKEAVTVAVDLHERPTWSKKEKPYVVGTKHQGEVMKAYRMVTVEVVEPDLRLTLAYLPLTALANRQKVVFELLLVVAEKVRIDAVLMDRGFFGSRLLDELTTAGFVWLMPVPKQKPVVEHLAAIRGKIWWTGAWSITDQDARRSTTFTLLVLDTPRKRRQRTDENRLLLGTNQPVGKEDLTRLPALYDRRWGIETGYRIQEHDFRVRTKTRKLATRLFLGLFQFADDDLWRLTNLLQERRFPTARIVPVTTGAFALQVETLPGSSEPFGRMDDPPGGVAVRRGRAEAPALRRNRRMKLRESAREVGVRSDGRPSRAFPRRGEGETPGGTPGADNAIRGGNGVLISVNPSHRAACIRP